MGTTAAKLQAALDSKEAIRQAIIAKDVTVPEGTPLREYPAKIAAIVLGIVMGDTKILAISQLTKAQYDALETKDPNTLYIVNQQ